MDKGQEVSAFQPCDYNTLFIYDDAKSNWIDLRVGLEEEQTRIGLLESVSLMILRLIN